MSANTDDAIMASGNHVDGIVQMGRVPPDALAIAEIIGHADRSISGSDGYHYALENVDIIKGYEYPQHALDVELDVFASSTVCIHTDEHAIPRYTHLLYLGGPDEETDAVHTLHVLNIPTPLQTVEEWLRSDSVPQFGPGEVTSRTLVKGEMFRLDVHCPHWMTVHVDGKDYGRALSRPPELGDEGDDTEFDGVEPRRLTGLFMAVTREQPMHYEEVLDIMRDIRAPSPGPKP